MPHALQQNEIKKAKCRRRVVRSHPGLDHETQQENRPCNEREPHLAVTDDAWKSQQRNAQGWAKIKAPHHPCSGQTATRESIESEFVPIRRKIVVVELAHYCMVI